MEKEKLAVSVNGKRTGRGQRFVLIHERSIKELTRAIDSSTSWPVKTSNVFGLPTGEGVPQGLRGWGVRLMGSRGRVPLVGSDKVRGFFCHARHGLANANEPRRARPNEIWYNV
ncbi:hypothetical protein CMV37_31285, partial [Bacillus cereus]